MADPAFTPKIYDWVGEILGIDTEMFKMATVYNHDTEEQHFLRERDITPEIWQSLRPGLTNSDGLIRGTGTVVRLKIEQPHPIRFIVRNCEILSQPPARDPGQVLQGEILRYRAFLDAPPGRQGDVVFVVADETKAQYVVDPRVVPKKTFNALKGMIVDLKNTPATKGMRNPAEGSRWMPGTGTRVSFKSTFDNSVSCLSIISQPENHPDNHTELEGKLIILAKDGAILEHPETSRMFELKIRNASKDFWAAARVLYGEDKGDEPCYEPANLIPVRFTLTKNGAAKNAVIIIDPAVPKP